MFRNRSRKTVTTFVLLVLLTPSLAAQEAASPLAQVPADAQVVIHIRGLERTKDRFLTLAKNAAPDLAEMLKTKFDEGMKEALEGRKIQGLPKDGSIFGVFTEMPKPGQEEPNGAVIFAVSDYKAFRDGYLTDEERKTLKEDKAAGYDSVTVRDREVYLVDRKGYAVVTLQKDTAAKFTGKYAGIDGKLPKDTAKKLLDYDAAVYVDLVAVNKEFGDQIKAFRPLLDFVLQQAAAQTDKAQIEIVKSMANGAFQFLEDGRGFLAAVDFRPEGLALSVQGRVGADTKSNSFLKTGKVSPLADIGKLPGGGVTYMAAVLDGSQMATLGLFLQTMSGGSGDKALTDLFAELGAAEPTEMIAEYSMPFEGLQVWKYKNPAKANDAYVKMFQSLIKGENFSNVPLKEKPQLKKDSQTHRNFKLNSVSLQWDFEKFAERTPQGGQEMAEVMKTMMGDGSNIWFGTDGKVLVQITAKDWSAAKVQLDQYLDAKNLIGQQPAFQAAMKQLPSAATMVTLVDGPMYLQVMVGVIGAVMKGTGAPVELPPYKGTPGAFYLGMSFTVQSEVGGFDLWFPAGLAGEIRKVIEPFIGAAALQ